jgi:hypothetical protein
MHTHKLTHDDRTGVFILETTDNLGNLNVTLFTAPDAGPFNVYSVDLSTTRKGFNNSKLLQANGSEYNS